MTRHWPFLEGSQKVSSTDEPKLCPPGFDHYLLNQNVYSSCILWNSDFPRVSPVLTFVAAQIFSLFVGKPQRTVCNEPPPGAALTNDSGQSPHPLCSLYVCWVQYSFSVSQKLWRGCPHLHRKHYQSPLQHSQMQTLCSVLIYLTYLYLFNFYSEVYPATIAVA